MFMTVFQVECHLKTTDYCMLTKEVKKRFFKSSLNKPS